MEAEKVREEECRTEKSDRPWCSAWSLLRRSRVSLMRIESCVVEINSMIRWGAFRWSVLSFPNWEAESGNFLLANKNELNKKKKVSACRECHCLPCFIKHITLPSCIPLLVCGCVHLYTDGSQGAILQLLYGCGHCPSDLCACLPICLFAC